MSVEAAVTFNRDVEPLLYRHCVACHRVGEAGPFPLTSYEDAKKHGHEMEVVTRSRFMPPWLPESGPLHFEGEQRLSDAEIGLLARWVDEGMIRGNGRDLVPRAPFAQGWQLGRPDVVLQAAKPFVVPATGSDVYWNFILEVPGVRGRKVSAVEIRPGNQRLVHHANMLVDRDCTAKARESVPGAGFAGMELQIASEAFEPDSHFLFWKPGSVAVREPKGMALPLDPGNCLVLNMHLQPSGRPETLQPSIGLYFTDETVTKRPMLLEIENDRALGIPAGEKEFVVTDSFRLPVAVDLLAIYPHAHYLGHDLSAVADVPGAGEISLINIARWDLNWQAVYRYRESVRLPVGTVIRMRYAYDNSDANVANRHHPPVKVQGGNRAEDEMAHLWLQILPEMASDGSDPRVALQLALSRQQVEKDRDDFLAQYNLASVLRMQGELREALGHYREAARLHPDDALVRNAFGSALLEAEDLAGAVGELTRAVQLRPDAFDSHYNLGLALGSQERFREAELEFRQAVKLRPSDAEAHANWGAALAQLRRMDEAKRELREALRLKPGDALAAANLRAIGGAE